MNDRNPSKKHILFVLYSYMAEKSRMMSCDGWSPLQFLCLNEELPFETIYIFYWRSEEEDALKMIKRLKEEYSAIQFCTIRLPFWDMSELTEKRHRVQVLEIIYEKVTEFNFDYIRNDYFCYFQGAQNIFRSFIFYFSSRRICQVEIVEILEPSKHIPYPGKLLTSKIDLTVYEAMSSVLRSKSNESYSFLKAGIKTRNKKFNEIIEQIEYIAVNSHHPLLILGPSGAGKSALVRRIYQLKAKLKNVSGEFIEVNCAAIQGEGAQSLLFGHALGAYTGATRLREGLLKRAHLGLLFLDEVGVLGLEEQALMLKAIEEKVFLPLGADREVSSNFQLICGTNLDLASAVKKNQFRADFFARINMWTFTLPSLAERPEDIEPNLDFELKQHEDSSGKHTIFTPEARRHFLDFATSPKAFWLGNFRDFSLALRRMCLMAHSGVIGISHVDDEILRLNALWKGLLVHDSVRPEKSALTMLKEAGLIGEIDSFEEAQLEKVLEVCAASSSLSAAGRELFAVSRQKRTQLNDSDRLRKFLARYDLSWETIKSRLA